MGARVSGAAPACGLTTLKGAGIVKFIERIIGAVETVVIGAGLLLMAGALFAQGTLGEALHIRMFEWSWALELSKYAMAWVMGAGASVAVKQRRHMAVDALPLALPAGARRALLSFVWGISCVICGASAVPAAEFVAQARRYGMTSEAMGFPVWYAYIALPFTAVLLCVRFGLAAVEEARGGAAAPPGGGAI